MEFSFASLAKVRATYLPFIVSLDSESADKRTVLLTTIAWNDADGQ